MTRLVFGNAVLCERQAVQRGIRLAVLSVIATCNGIGKVQNLTLLS